MLYRRFGRTGLEISALSLGGGYVGGILLLPEDPIRLAALQRVIAAGCNWIDTAHDYGQGESERTLGRLLPQLQSELHISTKFRLDTANPASFPDQIRSMLAESRALRPTQGDALSAAQSAGCGHGSGAHLAS